MQQSYTISSTFRAKYTIYMYIYIRIYMEFPFAIPSPFTFALLIDIFVSLDLINSLCFLLEKRD